ncbi:MAG TPA: hypothetical protein VJQ85_11070 [Gaiellaceae bacterium]|nr:hypothetical protein [Gaiellaceae bacterium]
MQDPTARRRIRAAMAEQSHREEMNAAIRAQRERQGGAPAPPTALAKPARKKLFARLRGK